VVDAVTLVHLAILCWFFVWFGLVWSGCYLFVCLFVLTGFLWVALAVLELTL
jgi:hypothetical protein